MPDVIWIYVVVAEKFYGEPYFRHMLVGYPGSITETGDLYEFMKSEGYAD
jgi:hypothetical protein